MGMKGDLATALAIALTKRGITQRLDLPKGADRAAAAHEFASSILREVLEEAGTTSCFVKAAHDEPLFVLRAFDRCAPGAVRDWCQRARNNDAPDEKVSAGMDVAAAMEHWQAVNGCKTPD